MLVQILDRAALSSLPILSLRAYLHSRGWKDEGPWGERPVTVFAKEHGGRIWEILVPHRDTIGGYAENMAESVAVLAQVESRSQVDVFYDLSAAGADVIRVRSINGKAGKPLSLRQSASLLDDARNMLTSAARAAEKPQAVYRGKLSSDVAEYLDSVRPLPGYFQGYDLTLHSPVPVELERQEDLGDDFYAPFSRRVTAKLVQGLSHTSEAIERVGADDTLEPFMLQGVNSGVSSNLCDALAELAKKGEGIEIGMSWASVRTPSTSHSPNPLFPFSEQSADILTEAAKSFRSREPSIDEYVIAHVVKLEREPKEFDGRATILCVRDGRPSRLHVKFEESAYHTVIKAFQDRDSIGMYGDIYRVGSRYELRNPRNLSLLAESAP